MLCKKRRRRKKGESDGPSCNNPTAGEGFSRANYDWVLAKYDGSTPSTFVHPDNPVGYDAINQYKAAVLNLHRKQVAEGANGTPWEHCFDLHCANLMTYVRQRKAQIKRRNYGEKLDHMFAPYRIVNDVHHIEEELWNCGSKGRHRYVPT